MFTEREELVKFTFPEIRKRCRERGVEFVDVDLRWGVTDEQKAEGKVLPICLAEIERCRPYFIGLLGERYGWVPQEIDQTLLEEQPWLKEHKEKSVTDLEILHGVLKNKDMKGAAFFYFRLPDTSKQIETKLSKLAEFNKEPTESQYKLADLKDRIRQSGYPLREDYVDAKMFGQLVIEDLWQSIDNRFPENEVLSPLDREAAEHEAFVRSRIGVYVGRDEYFKQLDEYAGGNDPPLIILGESGSGKSALLSNWALKYKKDHSSEFLMMHFIGASNYSADWVTMLRRIMGEYKRRFDIEEKIPEKPDELRATFADWLHIAAAKGRTILIIDALNQLEDLDGAPDLVWLPLVIPSNIRLILSTLPGRPLDELNKRSWPTMTVQSLNQDERKIFIGKYLTRYTKELSPTHTEYIVQLEQTTNPLYLQALLEELRIFGKHEKLDEKIKNYLEAKTIPDLFDKILARYEEDYEQDRNGLVKDVMSCLWAARRGLLESELLDITGSNDSPLPRAVWSPLNLAAEHSLVNRSGLINFSHSYFRQAVKSRYLSTVKKQQVIHRRLSDYFTNLEVSERKINELPWQLCETKSWSNLSKLLTDPGFFTAACNNNSTDIDRYWTMIEDSSQLRILTEYRSILEKPSDYGTEYLSVLSGLFSGHGLLEESLSLQKNLIPRFRNEGNLLELVSSLQAESYIYVTLGNLDLAFSSLKIAEELLEKSGDNAKINIIRDNMVTLLRINDWNEAFRLSQENLKSRRESGETEGFDATLFNHAILLDDLGKTNESLEFYEEAEKYMRLSGDLRSIPKLYNNRGLILRDQGDLEGALHMFQTTEKHYRELGRKAMLASSLGNQGIVLRMMGDFNEAKVKHMEEEELWRNLKDPRGLADCLHFFAELLHEQADNESALIKLKEEEMILSNTKEYKKKLISCFRLQSTIQWEWEKYQEALMLQEKIENLCIQFHDNLLLADCIGSQGAALQQLGLLSEALNKYVLKAQICRETEQIEGLLHALIGQLSIRLYSHAYDVGCLKLAKEAYQLSTKHGDDQDIEHSRTYLELSELMQQEQYLRKKNRKSDLLYCLENQANIIKAKDSVQLDKLLSIREIQAVICEDIGNKEILQVCKGDQGVILLKHGQYNEAIAHFEDGEELCRKLGNIEGLVKHLIAQGAIHAENKHKTLAIESSPILYTERAQQAYKLASEHGFTALADRIKQILASLKSHAVTNLDQKPVDIDQVSKIKLADKAFQKGNWEAAEALYQQILKSGESVEKYGPKIIDCILSARSKISESGRKTIEIIIENLNAAGADDISRVYQEKLITRLAEQEKPKISKWKFWK